MDIVWGGGPGGPKVCKERTNIVVPKTQMTKLLVLDSCITHTFPAKIPPNPNAKADVISSNPNAKADVISSRQNQRARIEISVCPKPKYQS